MGSLSLLPLSALGGRRPATDAEYAKWLAASQMSGAPADFGGAVFPNPDNIQVSDDTDSGIPVTRLPDGVTLQRGNWHGARPADISNPPKAQLAPTASKSSAAPIDFSKYEKSAPSKIDFSKYEPAQSSDNADFWNMPVGEALDREIPLNSFTNASLSGIQSLGRSGRNFGRGLVDLFKPPQDATETGIVNAHPAGQAVLPIYRTLRSMGHTVADSTQVLDAIHDINASPDPLGTYAKALQVMASDGAVQALTAVATEGMIRGVPKVAEVPGKVAAAIESPTGQAAVAATKAAAKELPAAAIKRIPYVGKVAADVYKAASKAASEAKPAAAPITPSEAEPFEGVTSSQTAGAGEAVEHGPTETPAQVLTRGGSTTELEKALNNALGGKPLQKSVPLREQVPGKAPAAASLPDGFTPVKSSVLRGYKYDPATQQFESVTNTGQHYVHGEVTPEAFEKFESADSKGQAWNQLRGSPGVVGIAKGPMGKPVPITRGSVSVNAEGEATPLQQKVQNLQDFIRPQKTLKDLAKPSAPPEAPAAAKPDLLSQLEESLDQAKRGVTTSAKPSDLLDRWGVDPKSFAAGREQTRGMTADDSAAAIDKIADGYKKGEKIDPVIEVRDAQNNLIEVDGRSRVLAAHKAGIKRIPIIVRRLQ